MKAKISLVAISMILSSGCAQVGNQHKIVSQEVQAPSRIVERNMRVGEYLSFDNEYEQMRLSKKLQVEYERDEIESQKKQALELQSRNDEKLAEINKMREDLNVLERSLHEKVAMKPELKSISAIFPTESSAVESIDNLPGFLSDVRKQLTPKSHAVVVGHSHGRSRIGEATLAADRADSVKLAIQMMGIPEDNIHVFASWGKKTDRDTIFRGVTVYVVDNFEHSDLSMIG